MEEELNRLKIDRSSEPADGGLPRWAARWILIGVLCFVVAGVGAILYQRLNAATEVVTARATAASAAAGSSDPVVLNATGYIVAAHKIEVASKVVGRVAWIGVDKGDRVRAGDVIVRLEDEEYKAQLQQARGQLLNLQARLAELEHGSRPEEIAVAKANVEQAQAELEVARVSLERTRQLVQAGVQAKQVLDDAESLYRSRLARVNSLEKTYELVRIGPRREQIDAVKGQIEQAQGAVAYFETQLANTVIRAPVTGTILERVVERGEFVTTSFVGERGAKGYVVSLADLNDLEVELDISQNDFNKLFMKQKANVTVDAYPDRKWDGVIDEMAPEANRQKATVQVKVKILHPDELLRPEMNAAVSFLGREGQTGAAAAPAAPAVFVPPAAVKDGKVFIVLNGRAVERAVKAGDVTPKGLRVEEGLSGGEDLVLNAPADLKDGARVVARGRQ
jgi:HlyD family secretion protein